MGPDDSQVLKAFSEAPEVIRQSLTDGTAINFMAKLPLRYAIHIDTAGQVTEFIRNMLLGFIRPDEFIGKLTSAGIPVEKARQITADLNTEVFVPLRDEMKKGGPGTRPTVLSTPEKKVMPAPVKAAPALGPIVTPAAPVTSVPSIPKTPPVIPIMHVSEPVQQPVKVTTDPTPSFNLIQETPEQKPAFVPPAPQPPVAAAPAVPTMRTMQHDMELVEHGNKPIPYPAPKLPHASQSTPARMFQTASVPVTSSVRAEPVPEMLHIVPDAPPQPKVQTPQLPPAPAPQAPKIIPSPKEFSTDPYREPI